MNLRDTRGEGNIKAVGGGNGERKCCDYNLIKTKINLTREIIQKKVRHSEDQILGFSIYRKWYICVSPW